VVLLVLAIVWGVLLVSWLRSRGERTFSDSVGTFRRHLTVLERAAPATVTPANRLRSGPVLGRGIPAYRPPAAALRGQRLAPIRRDLSPDPAVVAAGVVARRSVFAGPVGPVGGAGLRRKRVQKRRRDVFFALLAGTVGSLILSVVPGLAVMWSVQVLFDVLLVAYVSLLIRLRNMAAERELKLTFMPDRRPAARPRATYEFGGAAYGEVGLRRAAN
jgi:hypothetical protein